jgi:hypothetical protein
MTGPASRWATIGKVRAIAVALLVVAMVAGTACSPSAGPDDVKTASEGAAPDSAGAAAATSEPDAASATSTSGPSSTVVRVRDGDNRNVDELAAELAAGAAGDPEWISVLARLQAFDWLIARYPGEYNVHEIFSEQWAAQTAVPNQEESLDLGVYYDQPLPALVSVVKTGEIGQLVELEAVIESGEASVRQVTDDTVLATVPGGTARGLYMVGPDGPEGNWRIHSIAELALPDASTPPDSPTETSIDAAAGEETP